MYTLFNIIVALAITAYVTPTSAQTVPLDAPKPVDAPKPATPPISTQPTLLTRTSQQELRIGGGDLLQVTVFGASEYNYEVRVSDDGNINLPFLGRVPVGGKTPRDAANYVGAQLSQRGYFNNPQVGLFVKEYATQGVSVLGEVQKPGIYPLVGARTLFDMLSAAQGTTQTAGDRVSVIHRDQPQHPEIVKLTYDGEISPQGNIRVLPGDTIMVQKAGMVYVVGDVQKPSGIVMVNPNLTVLKAIALAQGTNPNASLDKARLVRKTSDGQVEIPLHLKQMLAAKIPDMRVEPEDVIFVPNSALKTGVKRGLEAAVATITGVIIYRP
jgi:polysaccharide export outer membrane protein